MSQDQVTLQVNSPEVGYLNIRNSPSTSGTLVTRVNDQTTLGVLEPEDAVRQKVGQQGAWLAPAFRTLSWRRHQMSLCFRH
jgi:hypothetical protein